MRAHLICCSLSTLYGQDTISNLYDSISSSYQCDHILVACSVDAASSKCVSLNSDQV